MENSSAQSGSISLTTTVPGCVESLEESGHFFASKNWASILADGLGATRSFWVVDKAAHDAIVVPVFTRGPFRVGYPGFPTGATILGVRPTNSMISALKTQRLPVRTDIVRLSVSAFIPNSSAHGLAGELSDSEVDTAILDLPSWTVDTLSSSLRRNLRRLDKSDFVVHRASGSDGATALFDLYSGAVTRNSGAARYSPEYFRLLVAASEESEEVSSVIVYMDDRPAAMHVAARHGSVVTYLHGGFAREYRKLGPADLAMVTNIRWAQSTGAQVFDFMSSPIEQPTLTRYKEKWGGASAPHLSLSIHRNRGMARGLDLATSFVDRMHRRRT